MNSLTVSLIILACVAGGALLGLLIRRRLPEGHLSAESKELLKLGLGLIGTMAALVLGLMVGSAKSSYDAQKNNLVQLSVKIVLLDRALAHYGPETKGTRELARATVIRMLSQIWPDDGSQPAQLDPTAARADAVWDRILGLAPKTEAQRSLQAQGQSIALDI